MKRTFSVLLLLALMLTGCGAEEEKAPAVTKPQMEIIETTAATLPMEEETLPEETTAPDVTEETEPSETVPAETEPAEPAETTPQQTVPQSKPQQSTTTQTQQKPTTQTQQKPMQQKPTNSTTPTVNTKPSQQTKPADSAKYPAPTDNHVLMFARNAKTIFVGDTDRLEIFYFGSKELTWYSSHPHAITVDQSGNISPIYEGNYEIYVTDGEYTAKALIFAPALFGAASGLYFDDLKTEITVGTSRLLDVNGQSPGTYIWYSSSDPSVASCSGKYITAVAPGTAIITARDDYGERASILVTVVPNSTTVKVDIHQSEVSLYHGQSTYLDWTYTGTAPLEWRTTNGYVAMIDDDGWLRAVGEGSCTIYLSDGTYADSCEVTVTIDPAIKAKTLTLTADNAPLYDGITKFKGNYMEFCVEVAPYGASENTRVTSSDSRIVKVSNQWSMGRNHFRLDFKKAGTCTIEIISGDDAVVNSYTVHVKDTYDCNPGKTQLTPGEYAYYATQVAVENGQTASKVLSGYLYLWLDDEQLTWESAIELGEMRARENYFLDNHYALIVYAGWDEEAGKHLFYHGY